MNRTEALAKARAARKMKMELKQEADRIIEKAASESADIETVTVIRKPSDRSVRKERIPFGVPMQKLQGVSIPGYHLRFINDVPGRIAQAEAGGYNFVESDEVDISAIGALSFKNENLGTKVARIVGKNVDGSAMYAYLMKLPIDFYEENQKIIQSHCDRVDEAIRRPEKQGLEQGYVPQGHKNIYQEELKKN